jgi:enoyl-CoA hydratase/carnithine racemase
MSQQRGHHSTRQEATVSDVLLTHDEDHVRVLTMNRPQARNALSGELVRALYAAFVAADRDDDVRAVVLTGADPAFCAGVDLKEAARDGAAYFAQYADGDCIGQVALTRTPVVGAVNGATFTGGLEIALGCDFLVASERAVFADTHARVGVLPGGGMTARLPHAVGQANARRMSLTGEVVDAARALRMGLVTEVVPHAELLPRAVDLAKSLSEVDPAVLRPVKQMYVQGWQATLGAGLAVETAIATTGRTDYSALEERRRAVLERNRSQL